MFSSCEKGTNRNPEQCIRAQMRCRGVHRGSFRVMEYQSDLGEKGIHMEGQPGVRCELGKHPSKREEEKLGTGTQSQSKQ